MHTPFLLLYIWWSMLMAPFQTVRIPGPGGAAVGGGGQVTLDTDNFAGTAGTALHTYNSNWDSASYNSQCGDAQIATGSNGVSGTFGTCDSRNGATWTNDQWAQATLVLANPADAAHICIRMAPSSSKMNAYCFGVDPGSTNDNYRITKWTAGTKSVIHASSIAAANNDVLNFQIIGTTFQVKINGSVISEFSVTDSSFSTGSPGLYTSNTPATTKVWSTWTAGSAS